jgi:hypothetical protein
VRTIADVIVDSLGLEDGQVERAVFVAKFDGTRGTMASRIALPDHINVTAAPADVLAGRHRPGSERAVTPAPIRDERSQPQGADALEISTSRVPRAVP